MLDGRGARPLDHVLLLVVVARGDASLPLDLANALRDRLAPRDERQDLSIDLRELAAERLETCLRIVGHARPYPSRLARRLWLSASRYRARRRGCRSIATRTRRTGRCRRGRAAS